MQVSQLQSQMYPKLNRSQAREEGTTSYVFLVMPQLNPAADQPFSNHRSQGTSDERASSSLPLYPGFDSKLPLGQKCAGNIPHRSQSVEMPARRANHLVVLTHDGHLDASGFRVLVKESKRITLTCTVWVVRLVVNRFYGGGICVWRSCMRLYD